MKITIKDFTIKTPIYFTIFLIGSLILLLSIFSIKGSNIKWNVGILLAPVLFYITYQYGHIYEFNKRKLRVKKLFGLLGENIYFLQDMQKVEYSISWRGQFDTLNMYFKNEYYEKKISIYIFQGNLEGIKMFLYFNMSNLKEISKTVYRKLT